MLAPSIARLASRLYDNAVVLLAFTALFWAGNQVLGRAVVGQVTAVSPTGVGFLTVHPCAATVPQVSMVQTWPGANVASLVIGADDGLGRWCIASSKSMHVLIDVSGYFA